MKKEKGQKAFNDLSDEEYLELVETVGWKTNIFKKLETIYSYVGLDEEGYLGGHYGEDGIYITPNNQQDILNKFIVNIKAQEVFNYQKERLEHNLIEETSLSERIRYLNRVLESVIKKVNSDPSILYGFEKQEIKEYVDFPRPILFKFGENLSSTNDNYFSDALLKGEGAGLSKFKEFILSLIDIDEQKIHEPIIPEPIIPELIIPEPIIPEPIILEPIISEPIIPELIIPELKIPESKNETASEELQFHDQSTTEELKDKKTFEDYLTTEGKKIFPFLKKHYKNAGPRFMAYMLFALIKEGFFDEHSLYKSSNLVNAINLSFNKTLDRRALSYNFKHFRFPNEKVQQIIANERHKIKEAYSSLP